MLDRWTGFSEHCYSYKSCRVLKKNYALHSAIKFYTSCVYCSPAPTIVGGPSLYLMAPLPLPQASIDLTVL